MLDLASLFQFLIFSSFTRIHFDKLQVRTVCVSLPFFTHCVSFLLNLSFPFRFSKKVKVAQLCQTLRHHGLYSSWNSPGQNTGVGSLFFSRGFSQPKDRTQVSHIAGNSLPAEPPGKPKNTGVGRLSLLQWIFLTQELNTGSPALQADSLPTELFGAK